VTSMMRRAMLYLGLAPEEEYDEISAREDVHYEEAPARVTRIAEPVEPLVGGTVPTVSAPQTVAGIQPGAVRTISREAAQASGARVSAIAAGGGAGGSVRTIPVTHAKPHVVAPQSFNDAQTVADRLKSEQPVIMNLQDVDRDLRRRLIDFASGLSYGLQGRMDRVADGVYLLSPANVEVSDDERRRLQERGLHS
jgi:cell division inhibitor SepF